MIRIAAIVVLLLLNVKAHGATSVVFVASIDSPIETLTKTEGRKIYLGIGVMRNGQFIRPLRNLTSELVDQVFLQNVVGSTSSQYQRRLLSNLLQSGSIRPASFSVASELLDNLRADTMRVTYILIEDGELPPGLKILRVIWEEL